MPSFQESMEQKEKRNSLRPLFGVKKIPGARQIRNVLDGIGLYEAFDRALEAVRKGYWKATGC
jgi:hypothetical protein